MAKKEADSAADAPAIQPLPEAVANEVIDAIKGVALKALGVARRSTIPETVLEECAPDFEAILKKLAPFVVPAAVEVEAEQVPA